MSRLYATAVGDKSSTNASRQGEKTVSVHARGWNMGIRVDARANANNEVFEAEVTGGSSNMPCINASMRLYADHLDFLVDGKVVQTIHTMSGA